MRSLVQRLCKNGRRIRGRRRRRLGCFSQGCSRLFIRDTFTVDPRCLSHCKVFRLEGKRGAIVEEKMIMFRG